MIIRISSAFLIMLFTTGCMPDLSVQVPYEAPKPIISNEEKTEIKYQNMVSELKAAGKTQKEIDELIPYADLPFKQSIQTFIFDSKTVAGNFLTQIERSINLCESNRGYLVNAQGFDRLERRYRIDYSKCIHAGSSAINEYFYREYKGNERNTDEKKLVNEAYISWNTYADAARAHRSNYVLDELAEKVKENISRAELSVIIKK